MPSFCTRVNVSAQRLYSSDRGGGSGAREGGGAFHAATRVDVGRPAGPLRSEAGRRPKHEKAHGEHMRKDFPKAGEKSGRRLSEKVDI